MIFIFILYIGSVNKVIIIILNLLILKTLKDHAKEFHIL